MKRILALSLISCSLLLARNNSELEALFELSLEELLNVEVTTASQEKESLLETPAIVSVITSKQLQEWGVHSVYEALSFLPGITVNESYTGNTIVTFRGVTPGLFNNKALFMINSHPVYERLFGSAQVEYIPLDAIERIEVVRSPASVLYGTQAISGVVNIITKQGDRNQNEVVLRAGSNEHFYSALSLHETHVSISGSFQKDKGYSYTGLAEDPKYPNGTSIVSGAPHIVDLDYQNDLNTLFVDVHDKDWRIQGGYFRQKDMKFGFNPWVWLSGVNDQESFYVDLYKRFEVSSGALEISLRYDYADKVYDAGEFPFPSGGPFDNGMSDTSSTLFNTVQRYSGELKFRDHIGSDLGYIVGTSFEYDKTTPMTFAYDIDGSTNPNVGFPDKQHYENYGVFTQFKYRFSPKWSAIAGVRVDRNSNNAQTHPVPRLGITYKAGEETYIKALYAEAYRSPIFHEKYAHVAGAASSEQEIGREEIKTYELALDSRLNAENTLQVALFWLNLEDEITRRPAAGTSTEYFNAPGREIYGIEASWLTLLNESTDLSLNASYMDGKDKTLEELSAGFDGDAPFIANYTLNATLSYHLNSRWSGTLSDQFVSSKEYLLQDGTQGSISNYNLTNLVLTYKKRPFEGSLSLKNIFDETYAYPEPVRRNLTQLPGGAGATGYLTLKYFF